MRSALGAMETLDRVAAVASYNGTVPYLNNGLAIALRTVAGSIVRGTGTRVYWVQTGGFDTHAGQGNAGGGAYATLMSTVSRLRTCAPRLFVGERCLAERVQAPQT